MDNTLDRGEYRTVPCGNVNASAWMDNKVFSVMSTCTQPSATGTVLRCQKDGTRLIVECAESVIAYNRFMGGVDCGDQLCGYYSLE